MLENFASLLREAVNLDYEQPILIGLSGGVDSLCLFHLMHRLGFKLVAAHFDHKLRAESATDAILVENLAVAYNVPFVLGSEDVSKFSNEYGLSIEEAARVLRYKFLFAQAKINSAQAVVVGHHADDQVETILMHFIRGSGLVGLRGMQVCQIPNLWSDEIALIRPLLGFWREEIDAYCKNQDLVPLEDQTNHDLKYWRNRIRLELIPFLETYNPQIKQAILRLSRTISIDYQWIDSQMDFAWAECVSFSGDGFLAVKVEAFKAQPLAVRRMLVRRGIEKINNNLRNIDFKMVERAVMAVNSPPMTSKLDLGGGIRMLWENDLVWLAGTKTEIATPDWPQVEISDHEPLILPIPGVLELDGGWILKVEIGDINRTSNFWLRKTDPYCVRLKVSADAEFLLVRNRKKGDRFKPFGMDGHSQKIADYMINVKMPARSRAKWPLVCSGGEILWVPGYTIGELARITEAIDSVWNIVSLELTRS